MPTQKRFFTRNKKSVYHSLQDRTSRKTSIGNKSVNTRESIRPTKLVQNKKNDQRIETKSKREEKKNFKKSKLPNISQIITDPFGKFTWQRVCLGLFFTMIFGLSLWQGFLLVQKATQLQKIVMQRSQLQEDLGLWEGITQKYPTYRDAYFQASVLAYRLGNSTKEQLLLDKTLQLDPNYLPAQNLENISR